MPRLEETSLCRACSTSTARRCSSSPARGRPATPTAPTASAGRSSSASTTLKFASREAEALVDYLREHREVTERAVHRRRSAGHADRGAPPVHRAAARPGARASSTSIRIGTKAPAYWPYRFVHRSRRGRSPAPVRGGPRGRAAPGADGPLQPSRASSRPPVAQAALRRIQATGAVVRCQAPLIRHVNDDAQTWADLWRLQVAARGRAVLHVRRARHRPQELLRGPAGAGVRDLHARPIGGSPASPAPCAGPR